MPEYTVEDETEEILFALAEEGEQADVSGWMRRYPAHAQEIARFAANRWTSRIMANTPVSGSVTADRVREIGLETLYAFRAETAPVAALVDLLEPAKARGLNPRALAERLQVPFTIIGKLQRRLIAPDSIPATLVNSLADAIGRKADEVAAYLRLPPTLAAGASYRADDTPAAGTQQLFSDALRADSQLTSAQRELWLDGPAI